MRPFLILTATLLSTSAWAQFKSIINDDFSSNKNVWEVNDVQSFEDGAYVINSTTDGDESLISRFIDGQKDFTLSADFSQMGGSNDCAFGITWGDSDENYNLFLVSSSGEFVVYTGFP